PARRTCREPGHVHEEVSVGTVAGAGRHRLGSSPRFNDLTQSIALFGPRSAVPVNRTGRYGDRCGANLATRRPFSTHSAASSTTSTTHNLVASRRVADETPNRLLLPRGPGRLVTNRPSRCSSTPTLATTTGEESLFAHLDRRLPSFLVTISFCAVA